LKVKYLLIVGDSVDGIGIFPGQEEGLNIKELNGQYEKLAEYLEMIRKDIKIVLCPGQHDGVRVAEPQPPITEKYAERLTRLENVFLVSNPSKIAISDGKKDFNILMYHAASMNSTSSEMESLRSNDIHDYPTKVVKKLLQRRMISGMHSGGGVVYVPTKQDPFVLSDVPDLITTGDWHRSEIDLYNNILIISNSCWQTITVFEEKMGNDPDYCKVPILNLKTREIKVMDFFEGEEEKGKEAEKIKEKEDE
jgi:DNA polymerase II small subunit